MHATFGVRQWCGLYLLGVAVLAWGCGPDLGECDMTKLGGSNTQPHSGQLLVNARCAGGRCHSADAKGDLRVGAPGDLNFDVVPSDSSTAQISKVRDGAENVNENREDMWGEIDEGSMPPGPPAGSGELSGEEKETIRNWLACGAEVVAAPDMGGGPVGADWTSIYNALVESTSTLCVSCHGATTSASGGGFILGNKGDACAAYARVVNVDAKTTLGVPPCAGKGKLVVPNNPDMSILLRKIEGGTQICGAPMPQGTMGLGTSNAIVMDMRQWIMNGAPKPMNCP